MSREIEQYSLFEHVNMEKMTPHFLKLAKCSKPDNKLTDILNDNNSDFVTDSERKEYIVSYYENLYKLLVNQRNDITGCIEKFLGPEILNSPMVAAMKISRDIKAELDTEITIQELDKAVEETRTKTAAGPDGICNSFIKKIWRLLFDSKN